jgi:hypothetical protein
MSSRKPQSWELWHGHNTYQRQVLAQIEVQLEALRQHLDARRAESQVDENDLQ